MEVRSVFHTLLLAFFLAVFLLLGARFIPWDGVNWGKIELSPASTITVTGEARKDQVSQITYFTAGVTVYNDNKDTAVNEVNSKMTTLIEAVKKFGIDEKDIQTQQVSVYEQKDTVLLTYPERQVEGNWRANNSISITLRDVSKASQLTDLLNSSGATEVSGPNFSLDQDDKSADSDLLEMAINDAKEKAQKVANASGRKLGKVITVTEGFSGGPIYSLLEKAMPADSGRGISSPIEPGTQTTSKSVTVIFELR